MAALPYRQVWVGDFEFTAPPGERPSPLCCVAREVLTNRLVRLWLANDTLPPHPFDLGEDSLFVAYYASAEIGCFLALGWSVPLRILDLFAEFRCLTSGLPVPCGSSLLGALAYFGLDGLDAVEKEGMRQLAMRGGPYTTEEQRDLLDYCQSDVDSLTRLLRVMLPRIDLPRALLRGRYMAAAARMEWNGIPIDTEDLQRLRGSWERIKGRLVATVDKDYGVFVPVGQRTLDPQSPFGSAILSEAKEWGIDPYRLADVVEDVWAEERQANEEIFQARQAARRLTGLTTNRILQWENQGKDYSAFPALDVSARSLADRYPALGLGRGYDIDGPDEVDQAGLLWEMLRDRDEKVRPKHHPEILRRSAELLASQPTSESDRCEPLRFSGERWAEYLIRKNIPWPYLPSGALAMDDDTFREMARAYPAEVGPIRELRHSLSQMRLQELTVGSDSRNRYLLSAFNSRSSRNQPSNSKAIFGPAVWLRCLIRPAPGWAVAYIDWSGQEYGIAAALSEDATMRTDYASGDPYLAFAKRVKAVPPNATKKSHPRERELFKVCCGLGVMYGAGPQSLALRLGVPLAQARWLLAVHRETYWTFWQWSDTVQDEAMLTGQLRTVFGWTVRVGTDANPRSLRNFPMQANGAEMLRLACCLATEQGIRVCAPVHDALLVEAPVEEIGDVVARTQAAMREASEVVLPGFPLRTDAKIVRHPDRFSDERGRRMWETVCSLLEAENKRSGVALVPGEGLHQCNPR